jgi:hypothetical protein
MPLSLLGANLIKFGLQAAPGILQGLFGRRQSRNAKNIKLPDRPAYEISSALTERLGLDKTQLNSLMPGTSYFQNQIAGNAASTIRTAERNATDGNKVMLMAAAANEQSNKSQSELLAKQGVYQDLQETQYKDSLTEMAKEQKNAWQWNKADAYTQELKAKMALKESLGQSGLKNKFAGFNNLMSAGTQFGINQGWFGGGSTPTSAFPTPPTLGNAGLFDNYQGLPGNYNGGSY